MLSICVVFGLAGMALIVYLHPDVTGQEYQIPCGGMYELISCPNYLGETIEWIGYAITTGSIAGTAFAFYTFANLAQGRTSIISGTRNISQIIQSTGKPTFHTSGELWVLSREISQ